MSCIQFSVEEEHKFRYEQSRLVVSEQLSLFEIPADANNCFQCLSYTMSVESDNTDPSASTIFHHNHGKQK